MHPVNNIIDIKALLHLHDSDQRLIGIDLGTKTIGVALSDNRLTIATPSHVIRSSKFSKDANSLLEFCYQNNVFFIILGLPLNMNGSEGRRVQSIKAFARNIGRISTLPIVFWDERLSTVAANQAMLSTDMSRKKRLRKIDAVAAGFILQGALDHLQYLIKDKRKDL